MFFGDKQVEHRDDKERHDCHGGALEFSLQALFFAHSLMMRAAMSVCRG